MNAENMSKYSSDVRDHTDAAAKEPSNTLQRSQSALVVMGNQRQREIRQAITNFLIQFVTKALSFIISFLPSSLVLDQMTAQQSASQAKLKLTNALRQRMKNCKHPAHKNLETTALIREIPTAHFELMVQDELKDQKLMQSEVANASNSLNARLVERLLEIDAKAPNHTELKLLNYQEWVDMLLKINRVLLKNMCDLEAEFLRKVRDSSSKNAESNKLIKSYEADIVRLFELIRQAATERSWNCLKNFIFETFEKSEIFEVKNSQAKK